MRKSEFTIAAIAIAILGAALYQTRHSLEAMKDVCQLIFWSTAVVVAWLTYVNARTGVLQPIRTEVFKLQIAELQNILSYFVTKSETELREQIALREFVTVNARNLLNDYCRIALGVPYEPASNLIGIGDGWRPLNTPVLTSIQQEAWQDPEFKSKEARLAFWKTYSLSGLVLPKEHTAGSQQLRGCLAHPVLPSSIKVQIENYVERVSEYRTILETALNECAKQLPQKYPTRKSLDIILDGNTAETWISNAFNRKISQEPRLSALANEIVGSVREYLQVEQVVGQHSRHRCLPTER